MSLLREAESFVFNQSIHASLNAFITPLYRSGDWVGRVRDADRRREHGQSISKVDGRLISFKDNICTHELPTTCASGILRNFRSPFNATVVEQLSQAGAIVAGKTNLDEFGMGSHSIHSRFGPVWSLRRDAGGESLSAGGSSGGSAVAIATSQCYVALGTDTGGSVRLPAAYTGTVGFKPSYGLISRWGVVAYANSLDTVGILGRDTSSVRDVFNIINRADPRDPTNLSDHSRSRVTSYHETPPLVSRLSSSSLRIGVPVEYNISELDPSVRHAWSRSLDFLQKQGHTIHPVSLPATRSALSAYYVLAPAEASSNLAKYDGARYGSTHEGASGDEKQESYLYALTRGQSFGAEVQRRILLGAFTLSADAMDNYFIQAQRIRRLLQQDFNTVFKAKSPLSPTESKEAGVDVLICPTAPSSPPQVSELLYPSMDTPLDTYMNDVFTVPASLAGLPAISVPVTISNDRQSSNGASLAGIQVIGQYGDDELVLRVGSYIEGKSF